MIKDFFNTKKISRGIFTITGLFVFLIATNVNAVISDVQIDTDNIDENIVSGTAIGTLSTTGGNSPYTYELTSGTGDEDNSKFVVDGDELRLNFNPDYENPTDAGDIAGDNTYATRVKVTDSYSDFSFEENIVTSGALDWEYFTIGTNHYLAVANYRNDTTRNIDSKIYKWNGTSFALEQSIATNGAYDWEYFTIGTNHYLAVANSHNNSTYNIDSKIYKWNGTSFVLEQSIATNGAYDWEYFTIGTNHYLAVANYSNDPTRNIYSKIYKWNGTNFALEQNIATNGAADWEYFTIGIDHYLAVANYYDGSTFNIDSKIYKWNGTSFALEQNIATNGAKKFEYFTIGTDHYLTVANHENGSTYNIDSKIYKWNGTSFVLEQSITTNGAYDWEYFTIGTNHYLAVANNYNDTTHNIDSKIYKWNGTSFVLEQNIATNGALDWEYFTIGTDHYLAVANYSNDSTRNIDSKIYKITNEQFEKQLTILVNDVIEEITISDPDNTDIQGAINDGYITLDNGTITDTGQTTTNIQVTYESTSAQVVFPSNTATTGDGSFDFSQFTIGDTSVGGTIASIELGIPNENLNFSQNITVTINVGVEYNAEILTVRSQSVGEAEWTEHATCIVSNGECTFTTDHATTYVMTEDGIMGFESIDINVEVQDTLSLDCYDKDGSSGDHDVTLGTTGIVAAGTPVTGESTCNVTTNDDQGYYLTVVNSTNGGTPQGTATEVLRHEDPNNSGTWYSIDELTVWDDTTIGGQTGLTTWTNGTTTGLGFSVISFPEASLTNNEFENTWVDGTCGEASNQYAGIPTLAQAISAVTSYQETSTSTDICYKVDVSPSQQSGVYAGQVTYTATTDASSYYK